MTKTKFLEKIYGGKWKYSPECQNWYSEDLQMTVEWRTMLDECEETGERTAQHTYAYDKDGNCLGIVFFP